MGKQEIDNSIQRAEKQNKVKNKMNTNFRKSDVTSVSLMLFYLADEQNIHFKCTHHILYLINENLPHS